MPITNHSITDEKSFVAVTSSPTEIAGLYYYVQLDCLVECAYRVAHDFFLRPQLYTTLSEPSAAPDLARLRGRYGSDEHVPSREQRDQVFLPVFGQPGGGQGDGQGDFARLRDGLLDSAAAFAERVYDTGVEMLRERVRTTHRPFRDYLAGLHGDALVWSSDLALGGVARSLAYPILRNPGVGAVFGVSTPPRPEWPFAEDSNADKLIEEIARQLLPPDGGGRPALTRESFSNHQRAALRGAEALATILDFHEENRGTKDLDVLITKCYTWGAALKSLAGQPPSASAYVS